MADADDKQRVLMKVLALLARAGREDTPIEEARTSALLGARLFVKHSLGLTTESGDDDFNRDEPIAPGDSNGSNGGDDSFHWRVPRYDRQGPIPSRPPSSSARAAAAQETMRAWAANGWKSKTGPTPEPRKTEAASTPTRTRTRTRTRARDQIFIVIESDYNGRCVSCRKSYARGDRIAWIRGEGATHYGCRTFWDGSAGGTAPVDDDDPFA